MDNPNLKTIKDKVTEARARLDKINVYAQCLIKDDMNRTIFYNISKISKILQEIEDEGTITTEDTKGDTKEV